MQIVIFLSSASSDFEIQAGPILESKDMGAVFQKKDKEMLKKEKILGNMGKNMENILKKGRRLHAIIARNTLLE